MSSASFTVREPSPDDPVVCDLCGGTLGLRGYLDALPDDRRAAHIAGHDQECRRRRDHQRRHRTNPGVCPDCRIADGRGTT